MRSDEEVPAKPEMEAEAAEPEPVAEPRPLPSLESIRAALGDSDQGGSAERRAEPLIPAGNPGRPKQWAWAFAALVPLFLLMASDRHFWFSVPLGTALLLVASYAVLDALGTFDDGARERRESVASPLTPSLRRLAPRLMEVMGALVALMVALRLAVAGVLPWPVPSSGVLITSALIGLVIAGCRVAESMQLLSADSARWFARRGFWLVLLNVLLYVPRLGSYSLSDPWETHYGEVSREMLARDDWLSFWWAQDGFFWSKPALDFWLQGLGFSLSGVHFMPDQMLAAAGRGLVPAPEWPARLPIVLLTIVATYFLYKAVAKTFGERAGLLAGIVLTTAPYWYLIAHQSMTDMPYVAPLTTALSLVVLGMRTDAEARVRTHEFLVGRRVLRLSAFHLLFGCLLLTALPQLVYLLSRQVTVQLSAPNWGFRWHWDEFFAGSGGGNCGLPGNEACRWQEPVNRLFQPALGALVWATALGALLFANRGERRAQRLYFLGAWFFTSLSALGKGAPGLVLPIVIALCALVAERRYRDIARLELVGLGLILACTCLPWYVQMYMRHGPPFTDRLLFHDMYKRAFVHVHDTNTGDDVSFRYYVWQLGYGLFPWTGLGAAGLLWWLRFPAPDSPSVLETERRVAEGEVMAFMALWFTLAFAMFTITLTKFHHYALPTVPPIAAVTGVLLDRALGPAALARSKRAALGYFAGLSASALLLVYGSLRLFGGSVNGHLTLGRVALPAPLLGGTLIACGVLLCAYSVRKCAGREGLRGEAFETRYESAVLSLLGALAAFPVVLVGRDLSTTVQSDIEGQARLIHLFSYNYRRVWPSDSLNFNGVFCAFTLVSALLLLGFAWPRLRRHALSCFVVVSLVWTVWGLDVYLVKAAPHWGQRETILAYYAARRGPEEPFVAYQMNWKGENFYTGNRVPVFVSSGAKFKTWIAEQKKQGVKVMFFTTEHSRISSLKGELGSLKDFKVLTSRELNNKFTLARAEF